MMKVLVADSLGMKVVEICEIKVMEEKILPLFFLKTLEFS
jgi:hypothetical protein